MGLNITTVGQQSFATDTFQVSVVMQSDVLLDSPVATLNSNFSTVYSQLGISTTQWDVVLLFLVRITRPAGSQVVYHFSVGFQRKGTVSSLTFRGPQGATGPQGPKGPPGATSGIVGPTGAPGATGPQGATGPAGPQGPAGSANFGGDVGTNGSILTVQGIQGNPVQTGVPNPYDVYMWDGSQFIPKHLTSDPEVIGLPYAVSFTPVNSLVEVGQTVNQPAFTASYNGYTPSSAILTNNFNSESRNITGSPLSFSSNQNYVRSNYGDTVVFTHTSSKGSLVRSVTAPITWTQRVFSMVANQVTGSGSTAGYIAAVTAAMSSELGTLSTQKNGSYSLQISSGLVGILAWRAGYGPSRLFVNGFFGGFQNPIVTPLTNSYGFTENYYIYVTENSGLGSIVVTVTD